MFRETLIKQTSIKICVIESSVIDGPGPKAIQFFMLNSAELEIYPDHKC